MEKNPPFTANPKKEKNSQLTGGAGRALRTDDDELRVAGLSSQLGHRGDDLGWGGQAAGAALGGGDDNGLGAHLGGGDGAAWLGHGQHGGGDGLDQGGHCAGHAHLQANRYIRFSRSVNCAGHIKVSQQNIKLML